MFLERMENIFLNWKQKYYVNRGSYAVIEIHIILVQYMFLNLLEMDFYLLISDEI